MSKTLPCIDKLIAFMHGIASRMCLLLVSMTLVIDDIKKNSLNKGVFWYIFLVFMNLSLCFWTDFSSALRNFSSVVAHYFCVLNILVSTEESGICEYLWVGCYTIVILMPHSFLHHYFFLSISVFMLKV